MSYPIAVRNGNAIMIHPVRKLRMRRGLTQSDLARQCNIDQSTVSNAENGHNVHEDTAKLIAAALGRNVDDLFTEAQLEERGKLPMTKNFGSKHSIISTSSDACKGCNMALPSSGVCGTCE